MRKRRIEMRGQALAGMWVIRIEKNPAQFTQFYRQAIRISGESCIATPRGEAETSLEQWLLRPALQRGCAATAEIVDH
jgi:hypothetical protein